MIRTENGMDDSGRPFSAPLRSFLNDALHPSATRLSLEPGKIDLGLTRPPAGSYTPSIFPLPNGASGASGVPCGSPKQIQRSPCRGTAIHQPRYTYGLRPVRSSVKTINGMSVQLVETIDYAEDEQRTQLPSASTSKAFPETQFNDNTSNGNRIRRKGNPGVLTNFKSDSVPPLETWSFDIFGMSEAAKIETAVTMFLSLRGLEMLRVPLKTLVDFVKDVRSMYQKNPYHHFGHAIDVMQAAYCFLVDFDVGKHLSDLDKLTLLLASLCHDIDHPGTNNFFQNSCESDISLIYHGMSVLESHSCSMTMVLAKKHGLFKYMGQSESRILRTNLLKCILSTDTAHHFDILDAMKGITPVLALKGTLTLEQRRILMAVILHAADISNPTRPWETCFRWSILTTEEFFGQGDQERKRDILISPNMDRNSAPDPAVLSLKFSDFIVHPLYSALEKSFPKVKICGEILLRNRVEWQRLVDERSEHEANVAKIVRGPGDLLMNFKTNKWQDKKEGVSVEKTSPNNDSNEKRRYQQGRRLTTAAGEITLPPHLAQQFLREQNRRRCNRSGKETPEEAFTNDIIEEESDEEVNCLPFSEIMIKPKRKVKKKKKSDSKKARTTDSVDSPNSENSDSDTDKLSTSNPDIDSASIRDVKKRTAHATKRLYGRRSTLEIIQMHAIRNKVIPKQPSLCKQFVEAWFVTIHGRRINEEANIPLLKSPATIDLNESDNIVSKAICGLRGRLTTGLLGDLLTQELVPSQRDMLMNTVDNILSISAAVAQVSVRASNVAAFSLEHIIPDLIARISSLFDADRSTIYLYSEPRGMLISLYAQDMNSNPIEFPVSSGIAGHVALSRTGAIVNDTSKEAKFHSDIDRSSGYRTNSVMAVPVIDFNDDVVGVLQVLNKRHHGKFTNMDINLLESIALSFGTMLHNEQLKIKFTVVHKEKAQLLDLSNIISSELKVVPLLHKIMNMVNELLDADRSTLFVYDAKNNELWSRVTQGDMLIRIPADKGIAGTVFMEKEPINIIDAYADSRFNTEVDKRTGYKTKNILCMPVINRNGDVLGVIQVLNKSSGPFQNDDLNLLQSITSQAAIALENATLYEEVVHIKNYNEHILQSMSNGVLTTDEAGSIVKTNTALLKLFKRRDDEDIIGSNFKEYFKKNFSNNSIVLACIDKVMESGKSDKLMDIDFDVLDSDSKKQIQKISANVTGVPLLDGNNKFIGTMFLFEDFSTEQRLRNTMANYVSKEIADELLKHDCNLLGGTLIKATCVFTDIRSFTTMAEKLQADEVVQLLNDYFTIMVDIVMDHKGILDKFIGDAIMAVFGVPFSSPNDADNAVRASISMLTALQKFNIRLLSQGRVPLNIGVGINTDLMVSGNIGSPKRMDYTVIGDSVNLASRLEAANKQYKSEILLTEMTVKELTGSYILREVDKIRLKGKTEGVNVFQILDHLNEEHFPNREQVLGCYNEAISLYKKKNWKDARREFLAALDYNADDSLSRLYVQRCSIFEENPPSDDWDGIWVLNEK